MAIKKEDLLKFSKQTELFIVAVEDDSSDNTEVKILILAKPVTAVGSIPTPDGKEMKVQGTKVYCAAEDIEELVKDCENRDGQLVYTGSMHLDVSRPKGRSNNAGEFVVTAPSKIWLTKVKFSRSGAGLRTKQVNSLNSVINKLFEKGTLDLAAETVATTPAKTEPVVTGNQPKPDETKNGQGKKTPEVAKVP